MNKSVSVLLFCMIIMIANVSAQFETVATYSQQGAEYMDNGIIINALVYSHVKVNDSIVLYMTPYEQSGKTLDNDSVECRVGITSPEGDRLLLLEQVNFSFTGENDIWIAELPGTFLNETGEYLMNWDCQDGLRGGFFNSRVQVTIDGEIEETVDVIKTNELLGTAILLLMCILLLLGLYNINKNTNYEKWNNKIYSQYENKNYFKLVLSSITYNIMKNTFVLYYLIGLAILTIVSRIVLEFTTIFTTLMESVMVIYIVGAILVAIYLFSYVQEWIMKLLDDVTDMNWGIEK